jgi:hypothetical protein
VFASLADAVGLLNVDPLVRPASSPSGSSLLKKLGTLLEYTHSSSEFTSFLGRVF